MTPKVVHLSLSLRSANHAIRTRRMAPNGFGLLQWIGLGKKFIVEELPDYVTEFQSDLLEIPAVLFPPDTLPVAKLLELVFLHKITES